ncbi:MAG TPA: YHS domain-containing protein [Gemmatimonadaceae bacterium]
MPEMSEFAGTLDARLLVMDDFRRAEEHRLADEMRPRQLLQEAFDRVADITLSGIIRPRLAVIAERFQQASLETIQTPMGLYVGCTFAATETFPVVALVCAGVALDEERQVCALTLSADLTPPIPGYTTTAVHPVDLDQPRWEGMVAWLEEQLFRFVDAYIEAHRLAATREALLVRDPVCGMMVAPSVAPERWSFGGETYSFCARSCRDQFMATPRAFLDGVARARAQ